jgi:hypothetical protein
MIRVLEVESPTGICMPARRIPELIELTGRATTTGPAAVTPPGSAA